MPLKTDYKAGDPLPAADLNAITTAVNNNEAGINAVRSDVATTNKAVTDTKIVANNTQSSLITTKADVTAAQTAQNVMQTDIASINSRLTVLETATPPPSVPGPPTGLTAGTITNTSVVVSWTAPTGSPAATSYTVRRSPAGAGSYTDTNTVTAPTVTATVTGLTQGTAYDIVVVSRVAAGPGGQTAPLRVTTTASFTPSASGTTIPSAANIVTDDGAVWTVVSGVIWRDPPGAAPNAALAETNSVTLLLLHTNRLIYQQNSFGDWWYYDSTQSQPWIFTSDPRVVTPPPGGPTPPAIANAVGFRKLTNGPDIRVGGGNPNWFIKNGTAVQQPDGAWRLISADGYGGGFVNCMGNGYMSLTNGRAYGGGFYVRYQARWQGPGGGGTGGWPGLWGNDAEGQFGGVGLVNSPMHYPPGGASDSNIWMENDVMEDPNNFGGDYGSALHIWYGSPGSISDLQSALPRFTWPNGATTRQSYHWYGNLWLPATSTTRGVWAFDFDGSEYSRVEWDFRANRSTLPNPPSISSLGGHSALLNVGSDIDWRHFYLEAGSGSASPVDLLAVEVWQVNSSQNVGPGSDNP